MQNYKRVMVVVSGDVYRLYSHEWHEFCLARAQGDKKVRVASMGGYIITKLKKPFYFGGKDKDVVMSMKPEEFPVFRIAGWGPEQFQAELDKQPTPTVTADPDLFTLMEEPLEPGHETVAAPVAVAPGLSPDRARLMATAKDAAMEANNEFVELYGKDWGNLASRGVRDAFRARLALEDLRLRLSREAVAGNGACATLLKFSGLFTQALEIIQEDR